MARQQGNKWIGDAIVDGARQRRRFSTQEEAEAFEGKVTLSEVCIGTVAKKVLTKFYLGTKDVKSAQYMLPWLAEHFGSDKPVTSITTASISDMDDYLREEEGLSVATVNRRLAKLSKMLNYALDVGLIPTMPKIKFHKEGVGRTRFLTREEEERIFTALPDKYRHYATFLLYSGCRCSEALKLQWQDINGGRVTFWETKNGKPRTIPLHSRAQVALQWTKGQDWIRPFARIDYDLFHNAWQKAKAAAGLKDDNQVVPHVLRHTCASRMAQSGDVDIYVIMNWLGHSSITVTKRYAHLIPQSLDKALGALG